MMVVVSCDMFKDEGGMRLTAAVFQDVKQYLSGANHELIFYPKNEEQMIELSHILVSKARAETEPNTKVIVYYPSEGNLLAKIAFPDQAFDLIDIAELKLSFQN